MVEDRNDKSGTKSEQIEKPKELLPLQEPGQIAGVLKELPKEVLSEVLKKLPVDQVSVVKASAYSGPLPPPGMLEAYNKAVPNAAERILKSFEKQQEHRMQLEENMMDKNFDAAKRGQYMGLSISIAGLLIAGAVGIFGSALAGSLIGITLLAGLVKLFIIDPIVGKSKQKRKEVS